MKNKLISSIALLFLLAIAIKVYADTFSVTAHNLSTESIGTVLLNLSDNSHQPFTIGGTGDYSTSVSYTVSSITINGQTIYAGSSGDIHLPNTSTVHVIVSSDANMTVQIQGGG